MDTEINTEDEQLVNSLFSLQLLQQLEGSQPEQPSNCEVNISTLEVVEETSDRKPLHQLYHSQPNEIMRQRQIQGFLKKKYQKNHHKISTQEVKILNDNVKRGFKKLHEKVCNIIQDYEKSSQNSVKSLSKSKEFSMSIKKAYDVNVVNLDIQNVVTQPVSMKSSVYDITSPRMNTEFTSKKNSKNSSLKNLKSVIKNQTTTVKMKSINLLKTSRNPLSSSAHKQITVKSPKSTRTTKIFLTQRKNITENKKPATKKPGNTNPITFYCDRRVKI